MPTPSSSPSQSPTATPSVTMRVDCATVSAFIKEYARCITQGGLFLRTRELQPVGARISFGVVLANGQRLLGGTGIVRWSQGGATPFDRPRAPGMGLRFAELDAESRQLVALIIATQPDGARDPEPPGPRIAELLAASEGAAPPPLELELSESAPPAFTVGGGLPPEAEPPAAPLPNVPRIAPLLDVPRIAPLVEVPALAPRATGASSSATPPGLAPRTDAASTKARNVRRTPVPFSTPLPALDPPPPKAPPSAALPLPAPTPRNEPAALQPPAPRSEPAALRPASPSAEVFALPPPSAPPPPVEAAAPAPAAARTSPPPSMPLTPGPASPAAAHAAAPVPAAAPVAPAVRAAAASPAPAAAPSTQGAARVTRAIEALRRQEYAKAETELQLAVAHEPENARYRFELGLVYFEWSDGKTQNHDGAAEASFARAADLDSSFDQPLVYLGQVRLRRRLLREAEAAFREALRRQPHCRGAQDGLSLIATMRWKQRALRAMVVAAVVALPVGGMLLLRSPAAPTPPAPRVAQAAPAAAPAPSLPPPAASPPAPAPAPVAATATPTAVAAAPAPAPPASDPAPQPAAPVAASVEKPLAGTRAEPPRRAVRRARPEPARAPAEAAPAPAPAPSASGGGSAAALVKAGDAALRAGQADEALAAFSQAIKASPGFAAAHRGLGSVYMMQGNDAQAAAAYKTYLRLAPGAPDAGRIQALLSGLE